MKHYTQQQLADVWQACSPFLRESFAIAMANPGNPLSERILFTLKGGVLTIEQRADSTRLAIDQYSQFGVLREMALKVLNGKKPFEDESEDDEDFIDDGDYELDDCRANSYVSASAESAWQNWRGI